MIHKVIVQIFLKVEKDLNQFPLFEKNKIEWQRYSNDWGFKYIFIDDNNYVDYLGEYADFYNNLEFIWQKIDLLRYLVINKLGGIYIDLDIEPKPDADLYDLLDMKYIINKWMDPKTLKWEVTNSILGAGIGDLTPLIEYVIGETERCRKIPCYKIRKIRFMLHTVGVRAFKRWCKIKKISYTPTIHNYTFDHMACSWINEKFG